jgi:hypothetical protein
LAANLKTLAYGKNSKDLQKSVTSIHLKCTLVLTAIWLWQNESLTAILGTIDGSDFNLEKSGPVFWAMKQ